uniref:Adhesion G protein-coupled receptor F7 n=1 Tax=Haplochromis burtoni TaxID=8153 RepID=A0A3Q3BRG3_HAPBU
MAHISNNSLVMQKSTAIGWGQTNSFPSWVCKHIITGVQFMTICGQTEYYPVFFSSQYIVKSPFISIQNVICSAFKHFSYIFTQSQLVIPRKIRVGLLKKSNGDNKTITMIVFNSLDNVLPARDEANSSLKSINGRVVLVQSSGQINNISFTYDILNDTLRNPECVFWNFRLFDGLGGWDGKGCELVLNINETETVTCNCNHLTSFSILMSPNSPKKLYLDIITYIGVGISMGSLVICLIIEGLIWRKIRKNETSYLRHVAIVNIAVSLLIANIWFIIGAAISDAEVKNPPACTAATFFIHFFYLALFFWMLASAMLLLYRTTNVFGGGLSKASMLAIGFFLGYGAPLIIATVTIAATAPDNGYIRENTICWLNWEKSKALLAFVIPALLIVVINLIILVVVLYKIIRRRVGTTAAQAEEKHVLVVIAKSLAVLTPFFGITWGLGAGILNNCSIIALLFLFVWFFLDGYNMTSSASSDKSVVIQITNKKSASLSPFSLFAIN